MGLRTHSRSRENPFLCTSTATSGSFIVITTPSVLLSITPALRRRMLDLEVHFYFVRVPMMHRNRELRNADAARRSLVRSDDLVGGLLLCRKDLRRICGILGIRR